MNNSEHMEMKDYVLDIAEVSEKYRNAKSRLLLLDYDGTLTPLMPLPELAAPGTKLLELLYRLSLDSKNSIYIISGREYKTLGKWLGDVHLNLVAEHGAWIKHPGNEWHPAAHLTSDWIAPIRKLLEIYSSKCDGSFVELKSYSIAWHYRNSDPQVVENLYELLIADLRKFSTQLPISIIEGNKVVEIKNKSVNKGTAVERILADKSYDFILACGDDTTDEDMFRQLVQAENAYTLKVGQGETFARFRVPDALAVSDLLHYFLD